MNHLLNAFLVVAIIFSLNGCELDSPGNLIFNSPQCKINSVSDLKIPDFGFAKMTVEVKNTGNGPTAFNVSLRVKLKKENKIISEGYDSITSLSEGESKDCEVWFSEIESHSEYSSVVTDLSWEDAEGNFYSN